MSHSNSSLNTFANCMAKYKLNYIDHLQPDKTSPHLSFGVMAHDVLYKAGKLRDEVNDGVVDDTKYYSIIPSEVLYPDLKEYFSITNWYNYFTPIIKQTAIYENQLIEDMLLEHKNIRVERELKMQLTVDDLKSLGYIGIEQPFTGIIDLLILSDDAAIILDYKFSSKRKTQDDFDLNSQLQMYALMVSYKYHIKPHNIRYGYIDIPKVEYNKPVLLSNGTLSRSKSQNVSQDMYKEFVYAVHGDDPYYNCDEGGYYHDCYCNLAFNKVAYLSIQYLDEDIYKNVTKDVLEAAKLIDKMKQENLPFVKKYDSYSCSNCEYLSKCKPWLTNIDGE